MPLRADEATATVLPAAGNSIAGVAVFVFLTVERTLQCCAVNRDERSGRDLSARVRATGGCMETQWAIVESASSCSVDSETCSAKVRLIVSE